MTGSAGNEDGALCTNLSSRSLEDDLTPPADSEHRHPVAASPGARDRADAALLRLCRVMTVATIRAGNAHDPTLSPVQVRVLIMLASCERPLSLGEVADCLGATASAASRVCARLVRDGYVLREPGPGNEIRLSLTPGGIAALTAVNEDRLARLSALLDNLSPQQRETVLSAAELLGDASAEHATFW